MSDGPFGQFYFETAEAMVAHARGLSAMIAKVQESPQSFDLRAQEVLERIRARFLAIMVELQNTSEVLRLIEAKADGREPADLAKAIDEYLWIHPIA